MKFWLQGGTDWDQAKGEPFAIPALDEYQVFVSSEGHIAEVNESSQDHLSLHDAMEDVSLLVNFQDFGELNSRFRG